MAQRASGIKCLHWCSAPHYTALTRVSLRPLWIFGVQSLTPFLTCQSIHNLVLMPISKVLSNIHLCYHTSITCTCTYKECAHLHWSFRSIHLCIHARNTLEISCTWYHLCNTHLSQTLSMPLSYSMPFNMLKTCEIHNWIIKTYFDTKLILCHLYDKTHIYTIFSCN